MKRVNQDLCDESTTVPKSQGKTADSVCNNIIKLERQRKENNMYNSWIEKLSVQPAAPVASDETKPTSSAAMFRMDQSLEKPDYAQLLEEQLRRSNPLIRKEPPKDLAVNLNNPSSSSDDSKDLKTKEPPSLIRTEEVLKRQRSCIYFADKFVNLFTEKCKSLRQQAIRTIDRVLQDGKEATNKRRRYEEEVHLNLSKRSCLSPTMIDDIPEEAFTQEEMFPKEPKLAPLTPDQLKRYYDLICGKKEDVLSFKFNLNIKRRDIKTLFDNRWVNDMVINFYMNLLTERSERNPTLPKVYAMNTFFTQSLGGGYSNVQRWTRKVNIFSKDIIPVPVNVCGNHWCIAIIHLKNKTIRYYDSMGQKNTLLLNALRNYLEEESLDKLKKPFDTSDFVLENITDVPQQTNDNDCGIFCCMYAEYITRNKPITFSQENMEYFRMKMVLEICDGQLWW